MTIVHLISIPCGLLLLAISMIIRYHIGRCRFNRRGSAGLQQFPTYWRSVWVTVWENFLLFVAMIFGLAGGLLIAMAILTH